MASEILRCTVIGNPIEHSLSPYIQQLFSELTGVRFEYGRTLSPLDGFSACVLNLAQAGMRGANVTRPFKFEALALSTHATPRAQLAGAANTLRFDVTSHAGEGDKIWWADNTDGVGLVRDITHNAGVAIEGKNVLLIGAGGAAAGVLSVLLQAKPQRLMVVNRTVERAKELVDLHMNVAAECGVEILAAGLDECSQSFDVVINSSASSHEGYASPVSAKVLKSGTLALDMAYGASATAFLSWAKTHGAHGRDGLGMLVEQGAESFYFWHGVLPDGKTVLARTRQELKI